MLNNSKEINSLASMAELSYQILQQNKQPMAVEQLIKKVFELKKIDFNNKEKFIQLYLDIVLSGCFVFVGDNLWDVKKDNLNLWDQEYFANPTSDEEISTKEEDIEDILDFDEFESKSDENKDNTNEDIKEFKEEKLDLNIDEDEDESGILNNLDENLEEEEIFEVDKNKNDEYEEEITPDYYEEYYNE
ncbi:DNA-directed RNA polymerase subunit delta [Candidatus Phytoplasma luffae]|uniref:RNAP delta factor n=1 Tax=Loofah witches'-broom phytoplasma TaxID=35773 RepID=A0A975INP0_LOWBP|nr:DNA-directed RNA polymerase subunit delta [Candidatus Phytoplasma luffae]QTX03096.1 DNA-directed RNA polymerase subunit delta [Candidatus Phytoplasma luffae]